MSPDAGSPWWMPLAARAGALAVRLLGVTWRVERVGTAELDAAIGAGERCIFAFWHARMLPLVYTHRDRGIAVLVSRHRDGELITRVIERLGFVTARGSSTRGGGEGVRELLEWAARDHLLAITPDGPRGPAERVKPGLEVLSRRTGWPVVPVATSSRSSWVFRSWDRFRVPRPFARVVVAYGEPVRPENGAGGDPGEAAVRLEEAIAALTAEVARRSGEVA